MEFETSEHVNYSCIHVLLHCLLASHVAGDKCSHWKTTWLLEYNSIIKLCTLCLAHQLTDTHNKHDMTHSQNIHQLMTNTGCYEFYCNSVFSYYSILLANVLCNTHCHACTNFKKFVETSFPSPLILSPPFPCLPLRFIAFLSYERMQCCAGVQLAYHWY